MKRSVCVLSAALLAMNGVAGAGQPGGLPSSGKSVMLYFSKPVGASMDNRHDPASFGLRLQQSSPMGMQRSVPLLDLRYRADGHKSVLGAGVMMLDSFGSGSSSGDSFSAHPLLWSLGIGAALLGGACAFSIGICDGGKSDGYSPPTG